MLDFCDQHEETIPLVEIDDYVRNFPPQKILDLIKHLFHLGDHASESLEEFIKLTEIIASTPDGKHLTYCKELLTCEDALFFLHGYGHALQDLSNKLVIEQHSN